MRTVWPLAGIDKVGRAVFAGRHFLTVHVELGGDIRVAAGGGHGYSNPVRENRPACWRGDGDQRSFAAVGALVEDAVKATGRVFGVGNRRLNGVIDRKSTRL